MCHLGQLSAALVLRGIALLFFFFHCLRLLVHVVYPVRDGGGRALVDGQFAIKKFAGADEGLENGSTGRGSGSGIILLQPTGFRLKQEKKSGGDDAIKEHRDKWELVAETTCSTVGANFVSGD